MQEKSKLQRVSQQFGIYLFALIMAGLVSATPPLLHAQTFSVLYTFPVSEGPTSMLLDSSNNLYGTTAAGNNNSGTVWKLTPSGEFSVLYSFTVAANGEAPTTLLMDSLGNLYGQTTAGGAYNSGTVWKLTPSGEFSVLYNFNYPYSVTLGGGATKLIMDSLGNLYGTGQGPGLYDGGMVWKLTPTGQFIVLNAWNDASPSDAGVDPENLVLVSGVLYGSASGGGNTATNTRYTGSLWTLNTNGGFDVLYDFPFPYPICESTNGPEGLQGDAPGVLYGTTSLDCIETSSTAITEKSRLNSAKLLQPDIPNQDIIDSLWKFGPNGVPVTLHNFNAATDGSYPGSLLLDPSSGNLYGTQIEGGANDGGTLWEFSASGAFSVLHAFSGVYNPRNLLRDSLGNFYGTMLNSSTTATELWKFVP